MKKKIFLCIGNGRDGTLSLKENIINICELNNSNYKVFHETYAAEVFNNLHENYNKKLYLKKKNQKIINKLNLNEIHVSNGYSFLISELYLKFKNNLKIIRIKRNKNEWLKAFKKNIKNYPKKHGNYTKINKPEIYRMAAWHFNEIKKNDWNALSLNKKLNWYYNKNDEFIKNIKKYIDKKNILEIKTENLTKKETLKKIANFFDTNWKIPKFSLKTNISNLDYSKMPKFDKKILGTFYSSFDYLHAAKNPVFGANYFIDRVFLGYKNRKKYIHSTVDRKSFISFLNRLKVLSKLNEKT